MCGSLMAVFVVVPLWGIERGFFIVSVSYASSVFSRCPVRTGTGVRRVAFAVASAAWGLAVITFPSA